MSRTLVGLICGVVLLTAGEASAYDGRFVIMRGNGEFHWTIGRVSPITNEAEGEALAGQALLGRVESMANIESFDQFAGSNVKWTLDTKFQSIAKALSGQVTVAREESIVNAYRANKRGLVISVKTLGFKPGSYGSRYQRNPLTGVRTSSAWGVLRYQFTVYGPNINTPPATQTTQERTIVFPSGGRVRKQADGSWIEHGTDGRFVCRFRELHRDGNVIVLREENRSFNLTIPVRGGPILWQYDGQQPGQWGNARWE
jgi:hypothetical protein